MKKLKGPGKVKAAEIVAQFCLVMFVIGVGVGYLIWGRS